MKKTIAVLGLSLLGVTLLSGCGIQDIQNLSADKYYVQIKNEAQPADKDDIFKYKYTVDGYDKKGNKKELEFSASENLKKETYLKVYYKEKKGVNDWEKIEKKDVPKEAMEKIDKNK